MSWLALDIGGANLKIADGERLARTQPFAMWQRPHDLAGELHQMIAGAEAAIGQPAKNLAITMTGELADCFTTRSDGVRFILEAVLQTAGQRRVVVYTTTGELIDVPTAQEMPLVVAAANWHALAQFAGRFAPQGLAILFDIGSTTTDLIPLRDGRVCAAGRTDKDRLASGELVYTGVERTAVSAVLGEMPYRQMSIPVAAELFATTGDAYLVLRDLPEEPDSTFTANGKPATRAAARDRLARMLCLDRDDYTTADAVAGATSIMEAQIARPITAAWRQVVARFADARPVTVITSGQGEFLAQRIVGRILERDGSLVSLNQVLGPATSQCAPAHALATLAREAQQHF